MQNIVVEFTEQTEASSSQLKTLSVSQRADPDSRSR